MRKHCSEGYILDIDQPSTCLDFQTMHLSNSVTDEVAHIFIAQDLTEGIAAPEETEELVIKKLPFEQVFQMVMKGTITDSMSVAGILKAKILIDKGLIKTATRPNTSQRL